MTDYPLFARNLLVSYKCPYCDKIAEHRITNLPSPNWDGDTVEKSKREESYDFKCQRCGEILEADVYVNIYYGELRIHKPNSWKEVKILNIKEYEDKQNYNRLAHDMKTDLDIFLSQGNNFQITLERLVLSACYYSSKLDIPFSVCDLIEDRDDYRYDFMRGFISSICYLKSHSMIYCSKVALASYLGSEVYVVCKNIDGGILSEYGINTFPTSTIKGIHKVVEYFTYQHKLNNIGKYYIVQESYQDEFDINSTSLNDDIFLYSLKYACNKKIQEIPINLLTTSTPYYSIVEAYGFAVYLKRAIANHFSCDFVANENYIRNIKIDDFFKNITRRELTVKYERNQMYIDGVFDAIESKINDYSKLINKK